MPDSISPSGEPGTPNAEPRKRPVKKTYLWQLAIVTYALVIVLTALAVWAYQYVNEKVRRERNSPERVVVPSRMR